MATSPLFHTAAWLPRWLRSLVPQAMGPSWGRAAAWGAGTFVVSFVAALPALIASTVPASPAPAMTSGLVLGSLVLAPIIETSILLAAIRDTRTTWWEVTILAAVLAAAHLPFRPHAWLFVPLFASFLLFANYLRWRRSTAATMTCWLEGSAMHATHNLLAMGLAAMSTPSA